MKEFTLYDMACLVYENYIDVEDLKILLDKYNFGVRKVVQDGNKIIKSINEHFEDRNDKLLDEEEELEKFNNIIKEIREL